jgi:hypothetical protein
MNERLEALRKRLRVEKAKAERMKLKDWWSVILFTVSKG